MSESLETSSGIFDDSPEMVLSLIVLVATIIAFGAAYYDVLFKNEETVRNLYFPSPNSESVLICKQYGDNPIAECDVSDFDGVLNN